MVSRASTPPIGDPDRSTVGTPTTGSPPPPLVNQPRATPQPLSHLPGLVTFNHPLQLKLDDTNFLLWEQQALAAIYGHRLEKFLDWNTPIPSPFSSPDDELHQIHSEDYLLWRQQDQLLVSWLLGSFSDSFLTRVVGCRRAWQIWSKIQDYVASMTRAKAFQLKTELRNTSKGNRTMSEYLLRIKASWINSPPSIIQSLSMNIWKLFLRAYLRTIMHLLLQSCLESIHTEFLN